LPLGAAAGQGQCGRQLRARCVRGWDPDRGHVPARVAPGSGDAPHRGVSARRHIPARLSEQRPRPHSHLPAARGYYRRLSESPRRAGRSPGALLRIPILKASYYRPVNHRGFFRSVLLANPWAETAASTFALLSTSSWSSYGRRSGMLVSTARGPGTSAGTPVRRTSVHASIPCMYSETHFWYAIWVSPAAPPAYATR